MTGIVFDIKEFSLQDGPGARTTVFLKGCPLRCRWCHNPEGLKPEPELMVKHILCRRCGRCLRPCGHAECEPFGRCVHACPNGLLTISGQRYEAGVLAEILRRNEDYYRRWGGGVTFSGGEPLMQAQFLLELTGMLDCSLALQTSGYAEEETFRTVVQQMDYVKFDIKLADRSLHRRYTGVCNDRILANLDILRRSGTEFVIRTPLIPGITDTDENLTAIQDLVQGDPWETLPYNVMAGAKYPMLGLSYSLGEDPDWKEKEHHES